MPSLLTPARAALAAWGPIPSSVFNKPGVHEDENWTLSDTLGFTPLFFSAEPKGDWKGTLKLSLALCTVYDPCYVGKGKLGSEPCFFTLGAQYEPGLLKRLILGPWSEPQKSLLNWSVVMPGNSLLELSMLIFTLSSK